VGEAIILMLMAQMLSRIGIGIMEEPGRSRFRTNEKDLASPVLKWAGLKDNNLIRECLWLGLLIPDPR
jgi:hypothetical protein